MSTYYFEEERRYRADSFGITYGVQLLIMLNTLIFVVMMLVDIPFGTLPGMPPGGPLVRWLEFSPDRFLHFEIWGIFTYMFVHSGLHHLFVNMLMLFIGGSTAERALGTTQFLFFYCFCGVLGACANFLLYFYGGGEMLPVIGASGAVLGVLVAFAMVNPDQQLFIIPFPFPITARALVIILAAINIADALTSGGEGISVATHLGGMVAGYLYMKLRPNVSAWRLRRRIARGKKRVKEDEKLAEAIDNIFELHDRDPD